MRVKRFLANAQLLRQIIHGHAPESVAEKMRPRGIDNSPPVRIALLASRPRLGRPFHIAATLITVWKLIQYIWFPQPTIDILPYFSLAAAKREITRKPRRITNLIAMA